MQVSPVPELGGGWGVELGGKWKWSCGAIGAVCDIGGMSDEWHISACAW